jgi:hypothetical protein
VVVAVVSRPWGRWVSHEQDLPEPASLPAKSAGRS